MSHSGHKITTNKIDMSWNKILALLIVTSFVTQSMSVIQTIKKYATQNWKNDSKVTYSGIEAILSP